MKNNLVTVLFIMFVLAGCSSPSTPSNNTNSEPSSPKVVITDSGNSDKITSDFTVTGSCSNGKLDYSGEQIKPKVDVAFVNFRVHDTQISGYSIETSGPHDLLPTGSGSSRVSLDAGTYYVEVENFNSEWEFSITCR